MDDGPDSADDDPPVGSSATQIAADADGAQEPADSPHHDAAPSYDPMQLRRCISLAFSSGELSKFAERMNIFIGREDRMDDSARRLVRAMTERGKLALLVESLKAHKPLVQWPTPQPRRRPPTTPSTADGAAGAPIDLETTAGSHPPSAMPDAAPAAPGPPPSAAPIATRASGGRLADLVGRRLLVVLLVTLAAGACGGALVIYLLTGSRGATTAASGAAPVAIANEAANHLRRAVAAVTRACGLPPTGGPAREALTRALKACSVPEIRPGLPPGPMPPRPTSAPRVPPPPEPPRAHQPSHAPACLDRCHLFHAQCKARECGREPASSSAYADYQRCLARCLAKYSRCRLSCP